MSTPGPVATRSRNASSSFSGAIGGGVDAGVSGERAGDSAGRAQGQEVLDRPVDLGLAPSPCMSAKIARPDVLQAFQTQRLQVLDGVAARREIDEVEERLRRAGYQRPLLPKHRNG